MNTLTPLALAGAVILLAGCGGSGTGVDAATIADVGKVRAHSTTPSSCKTVSYSPVQDNVVRAYIAYYGRPADSGGLAYWADRVTAAGGSLNAIMADFGTSREFTERYGSLGHAELVTGIYRQLFGRNPDTAGLNYYVGELSSGRKTLQSIALDVLFGAQGADATIVTNRLAVAKSFTSNSTLQSNYLNAAADGNAMAAILGGVQDDANSTNTACSQFDAMLDALGGSLTRTLAVTKFGDSNDGICDSDCSLREAVTAANTAGGRVGITLAAGTYTVNLGQIMVNGNVQIHGPATGSAILDGSNKNRFFALENANAHLVLSRLTLQNGSSDYGGALMNKGTLILDRVTLRNNSAGNGGAILNTANLTALAVTLSGNRAVSNNSSTGFGGALNNESGTYGLYASQVQDNTSTFNGAGIYAAGSGTIVNSTFSRNQSGATGGGIDNLGTLALIGARFANNTGNDGGALSAREAAARVTVTTSTFEDNIASGVDLGGGGAIFNYAGTVGIKDSVFNRNKAYGEGGGAIETNGALTLNNAVFTNNVAQLHSHALPSSAPGFGGALLIIASSVVTIDNAQFSNNTADNSGGAIYNDQNTQLTIANSQFTSNKAQGLYAGGGGYGGAIISEGNVTLNHCTLSANSSKVAGGGLSTKFGTATLNNSSISGNSSLNGGGVVAYTGTLLATDVAISNNTSSQNGAGLLNDLAQATLTRVTLTGNTATSWGGAIANNNSVGTISLIAATVSANTAPEGSAFVNFGTINLRDSTIAGTCTNHKTVNNQGGNSSSC